MRYVELAGRLTIGTIFVVALAGKVSSRAAFVTFIQSLAQMDVLPRARVATAARAVVGIETAIVVLLTVPVRFSAIVGFLVAIGLLVVFTAAIAHALRHGNRAPCRCFGASSAPLGRRHLIRNTVLLAVALLGLAAALAPGQASLPGGLLAAGTGLVAGMVIAAYDDLADLVLPTRNR